MPSLCMLALAAQTSAPAITCVPVPEDDFAVGQGQRHAETSYMGPGPHLGNYQRMTLRNSSHQFFSLKVW